MTSLHRHLLPFLVSAVFSLAVFAADPKAARYYEDAQGRYDKQDLPGAIIQLKNALQIDPNMLAAHVLLGKALLNKGDPVGAEVEFDTALRLGVNRAEVLLFLGQSYLQQGKYSVLLERVTPGGLPVPQQVEVLVSRAYAEAESGHAPAATRVLEEARALDPRSMSVLLAQATLGIRAGDTVRAAMAIDEALSIAPGNPVAWNLRGSVQHVRGDVAGALAAYAKAAELNPRYLDPRVSRAALLVDTGRMADAEQDLAAVLALQPREPRANYLQSVVAASRGDRTAAKAALEKVVRLLDPVSLSTLAINRQMLLLAGLAHYELGNQEKALERLTMYVRRYADESGPSKLLASLHLDRGESAAARSLLEPVLRKTPDDPRALSLLAAAYMKDGNYRKATELLDQAVRVSGGAADIRVNFGLSLVGTGQADRGIDQLRQAYDRDPKQIQAGIILTTLHLKKREFAKALEIIERVVRADPANLAAINLMGVVQAAAGDRAGGRKAFEQVLARDSGYQAASLNLARLEGMEGRHQAARERLGRLVRGDIRNIDAMIELASVEEAAGNTAEAVRWLEKARSDPRGKLPAGIALCELHLRGGNPDPALSVARELTTQAPENLVVLGLLARVQMARKDLKSARDTLKDMTRYANYDSAAQFEIARLQVAAGNPAGAAYSLDKALDSKPDFLAAMALYAEVETDRKSYARAEQRIKSIADKFPASSVAARLRGDLALARGQHPAALAAYGEALKKEDSADLALRVLRAHLANGELAKGVAFLDKWNRDHTGDLTIMRTLAEGYVKLEKFVDAKGVYRAILQIRPDDPMVLNNLALVAVRLGDKDALELAERANGLRPNDPVVIDTLGWVLVRLGQTERGTALLRDARLRDPDNPEVRYHLAVALNKSGRNDQAREELAAALKPGIVFDGMDDARKLQGELSR